MTSYPGDNLKPNLVQFNLWIKKLFAALMCAVMLTGFAACGKKADEKKEDVPITSTWKFDHMIKNGEEISDVYTTRFDTMMTRQSNSSTAQ